MRESIKETPLVGPEKFETSEPPLFVHDKHRKQEVEGEVVDVCQASQNPKADCSHKQPELNFFVLEVILIFGKL